MNIGNTTKPRLIFSDGRIEHFNDQQLMLKVYYALQRGVRCAFRGAGDTRPVYSWDCVDVLP